jgi:Raf kinase inhibitor-like YbhB/YbcL family protein
MKARSSRFAKKESYMITWEMKRVLPLALAAFAAVACSPPVGAQAQPGLTLSTTAFGDGGIIPDKYTAAASATTVSPKLTWTDVPGGVVTFVLLEHDPDTSVNKTTAEILHWMMFNIPGATRELPEGVPVQARRPDGSIQGLNYLHKAGYAGMGAPAPGPDHHYTFELFALDTKLNLGASTTQAELLKAMDGHVIAKAVVVGRFHLP